MYTNIFKVSQNTILVLSYFLKFFASSLPQSWKGSAKYVLNTGLCHLISPVVTSLGYLRHTYIHTPVVLKVSWLSAFMSGITDIIYHACLCVFYVSFIEYNIVGINSRNSKVCLCLSGKKVFQGSWRMGDDCWKSVDRWQTPSPKLCCVSCCLLSQMLLSE